MNYLAEGPRSRTERFKKNWNLPSPRGVLGAECPAGAQIRWGGGAMGQGKLKFHDDIFQNKFRFKTALWILKIIHTLSYSNSPTRLKAHFFQHL